MIARNNLRVLMAKKKVNIQEVSDATGLSRKSISKLYNEQSIQITFEVMAKLCEYFQCDISELILLEEEK
ncbi:MAG: helix-turn-helix domain-containing protein [Bacillota bacterium]